MRAFTRTTGRGALLGRNNVDTDAIIPKQFMKTIGREGLGPFAFDAWRYLDEGYLGQDCSKRPLNPDFPLNRPEYAGASILVTRRNFGCGSSREHAVWALDDMGIRVVIAESFGDIFRDNCLKNGLLAIALPEKSLAALVEEITAAGSLEITVDLERQQVTTSGGGNHEFAIDAGWRERLLHGVDDVELTLQYADDIREFERHQRSKQPWLFAR